MAKILCLPSTQSCPYHTWFRGEWVIEMLGTWSSGNGSKHEFPKLTDDQRVAQYDAYLALVQDPLQAVEVKPAIARMLRWCKLEGAYGLLEALQVWYLGLESPTEGEIAVGEAIAKGLSDFKGD